MDIERIAGEGYGIIKKLGSAENILMHSRLKFILFQAAGNGYLWIDGEPRHDLTEKNFLRNLQATGEDAKTYVPMCKGDIQALQNSNGRVLLKFSDNGASLSKYGLLRRTLDEFLDKGKFDYAIG